MDGSASERYALFPLTVFDAMFEQTTFVTGWLLEGDIDTGALASALDRVTQKWRMLSGRLHSIKQGYTSKWFLRIPLGPLPKEYTTYTLTTSTSRVPLSNYVRVPIPSVSNSLPPSVFLDSSIPKQYVDWESKDHPLTCWNIVHFPASANNGVSYTCVGFARCHGIFDGGGAAFIMDALIAEIKGEEWVVPSLPHEGVNTNPLEQLLANELLAEHSPRSDSQISSNYTPIDMAGFVKMIAWHKREKWLRGGDRRIILMPKAVLDFLVEDVKTALRRENRQLDNITTGDIMVAWIFKTIYSTGVDASTTVHCTNLASFRSLLTPEFEKALEYPHNAFTPLPYPVLSVADLNSFSLHELVNLFAACRASFSLEHVVSAYNVLQKPCFPVPPGAQDTLMVSNVSASRILESDWSPLGSKRTLCGYRYQMTPSDVLFTNAIYIAGRLGDGTVILDGSLNKARFELLSGEVQRLSARLARNQIYNNAAKSKATKRR